MFFKLKILFPFFILILFYVNLYSQSEIGVTAGINQSQLYGPSDDFYYRATFKPYVNYTASIFYKEPLTDRITNGFELESMHVKSSIDAIEQIGVAHTYHYNVLLDLNYVNLHFLYAIKLFSIQKTKFTATISPYVGYLIHSKAVGYGTRPTPYTYIDSLGKPHDILWDEKYNINETQTKMMRKINIGLSASLDASFPVNDKLTVLLKAAYDMGAWNVMKQEKFTGIRGCILTVGVTYGLTKKYLHFSDWKSRKDFHSLQSAFFYSVL
jgi:hypothetical protein